MKILLSPAKMMSVDASSQWTKRSQPNFLDKTIELQNNLKEFSPSDLENLLDISPKLSKENWERNQEWKENPTKDESLQAILAFKGEVYRGLQAETLNEKALEYLQNNLLIISGLYGLLHPSDEIMQYRLEMGKKLKSKKANNLYMFWKEILTSYLSKLLKKDEPILNLASKEYFKVFDTKKLQNPIIEVDFKDYKNGSLKSIMMYFKNARGKMTRWCAENNIQDINKLKVYNEDGYEYSEDLSKENNLVFIR
ncbi:peroxide stress protein YaaA [Apibacter muscae]|uniref:peroxide stress protein YaaA n=1 Tax=Apibacter muscae TaxID=2509004 RepID=UPI0011AE1201|nr:peroxide stress protein YaaA [Apibacter muscae]TWP24827.1 peroxide stress protein YaaA [Apibacter muscae]